MAERVTERYARALIALALEEKIAKQVRKELEQVAELLGSSEELKTLFLKRVFSGTQKGQLLKEVFSQEKMSDVTKNFLYLLAEKNRLHLFSEIGELFSKKYDVLEDTVDVEVSVASALSVTVQDQVQEKLSKLIGKKLRVVYQTDDSLIGGMVAKIGNQILDGSLKMQLKLLQKALVRPSS